MNADDAIGTEQRCASPCATCPWRRQNQTKDAIAKSPVGENGDRWYSTKNLRRLWGGIRDGEGMLCHATDPNSKDYGGKGCKPGHERVCVGALILVARVMAVANKTPRGGKLPRQLSRYGYLGWIERFTFRGTPLGLPRESMPVVFDGAAARDVRVPWRDPLLNDE